MCYHLIIWHRRLLWTGWYWCVVSSLSSPPSLAVVVHGPILRYVLPPIPPPPPLVHWNSMISPLETSCFSPFIQRSTRLVVAPSLLPSPSFPVVLTSTLYNGVSLVTSPSLSLTLKFSPKSQKARQNTSEVSVETNGTVFIVIVVALNLNPVPSPLPPPRRMSRPRHILLSTIWDDWVLLTQT